MDCVGPAPSPAAFAVALDLEFSRSHRVTWWPTSWKFKIRIRNGGQECHPSPTICTFLHHSRCSY